MKILTTPVLAAALALPAGIAGAQGALQDVSPIERSAAFERGSDVWDDNWGSDRYGYYDEDFSWRTGIEERERWNTWYGNADAGWNEWYEDIGDEDLFDVGVGNDALLDEGALEGGLS